MEPSDDRDDSGPSTGAGPGAGPVVHLHGAVALLGSFPALAGADLDVYRREIVLLRGPNGAGKTTLLRVLAGLVPVTRGEAVVLGVDLVVDRRAVRHRVGLLGHSTGLYDDLTVADNVVFWARAAAPDGRMPTRRWSASGSTDGFATWRWVACPPASGVGPRWPASSPDARSSGSSTNPMPASIRRAVTSSTSSSVMPPWQGRPS